MLIVQGGHLGANKKGSRNLWRQAPYGVNLPYVRNSMTRPAYEFMRRYIHFADNDKFVASGQPGHNPLWKVVYPLNLFMTGIRKCWNAGRDVTINEGMILYKGRAVNYVQYMMAKPIKHGVKVYMICCAASSIMLAFEIYVGREGDDKDGSALAICDRLITAAGLAVHRGCVLFTDNWYTTVRLAIYIFTMYGWLFNGTVTPTEKKQREDLDFPFLKLSKGALNELTQGWFREAVV